MNDMLCRAVGLALGSSLLGCGSDIPHEGGSGSDSGGAGSRSDGGGTTSTGGAVHRASDAGKAEAGAGGAQTESGGKAAAGGGANSGGAAAGDAAAGGTGGRHVATGCDDRPAVGAWQETTSPELKEKLKQAEFGTGPVAVDAKNPAHVYVGSARLPTRNPNRSCPISRRPKTTAEPGPNSNRHAWLRAPSSSLTTATAMSSTPPMALPDCGDSSRNEAVERRVPCCTYSRPAPGSYRW
jgi:hypothetical protein